MNIKIQLIAIMLTFTMVIFSQVTELDDLSDVRTDNNSIYLGAFSGQSSSQNYYNVSLGQWNLYLNTIGSYNSAIGSYALHINTTGSRNSTFGSMSMGNNSSGSDNCTIGYKTLQANSTGSNNTAIGSNALFQNSTGFHNIAIGSRAKYSNSTGSYNVGIGYESGFNGTYTSENVAVGYKSLRQNAGGNGNVALGHKAGYSNFLGHKNIFLGYQAGYNETGGGRLYIENSSADSQNALIYGEFSNDFLRVNGDLELNHPNGGVEGHGLKINNTYNNRFWRIYTTSGSSGDLRFYSSRHNNQLVVKFNGYSGAYWNVSDKRLKTNFKKLHFNWDNFMTLNTLTYMFKEQKNNTKHIGLIAQEVKKIYPELVDYTKEDDVYMMNYAGFGIVAIKAVQELKKEVLNQNQELKRLEKNVISLQQKLMKYQEFEKRLKILEENNNLTVLK